MWLQGDSVMAELQQAVKQGKSSIKEAYGSFRLQYTKVQWKNLVLASGIVPKHL